MKFDKYIIAMIAITLCIAIFCGIFSLSSSSYDKATLTNAYTNVYNTNTNTPTTIEKIQRSINDIIDTVTLTNPEEGGEYPTYYPPSSNNANPNDPNNPNPNPNPDPNPPNSTGNKIVDAATIVWNRLTAQGMHYHNPPDSLGVDCSRYVFLVCKEIGYEVPGNSRAWMSAVSVPHFTKVATVPDAATLNSSVQPGDIVAWNGHVQIYYGDGKWYSWGGTGGKIDNGFPQNMAPHPHAVHRFSHRFPAQIWRLQ